MDGGVDTRKACPRCHTQKRKCEQDCIFAHCFPPDQPQSFENFKNVRQVFGADNFIKSLQGLPVEQQEAAKLSMVLEANARVRDPIFGCTGRILALQNVVDDLQRQLNESKAEVERLKGLLEAVPFSCNPSPASQSNSGLPY